MGLVAEKVSISGSVTPGKVSNHKLVPVGIKKLILVCGNLKMFAFDTQLNIWIDLNFQPLETETPIQAAIKLTDDTFII